MQKVSGGDMFYANDRFSVVWFTCDISTTGTQAVTGLGFAPKGLIFWGTVENTNKAFWGFDAGGTKNSRIWTPNNVATPTTGYFSSGQALSTAAIGILVDSSNYWVASVTTWGSDGFTLTKAKGGSPTGTADIYCMAFR